jgi:hypothetical protein
MATGNNQVVIENPVINSPFAEPPRHFRFSDEGIRPDLLHLRVTTAPRSGPGGRQCIHRLCVTDFRQGEKKGSF